MWYFLNFVFEFPFEQVDLTKVNMRTLAKQVSVLSEYVKMYNIEKEKERTRL